MRKHTHQVVYLKAGPFVWGEWHPGRTHESRKAAQDDGEQTLAVADGRYVSYKVLPLIKCK